MADFEQGLFGCFDDLMVCLLCWFVPCYQVPLTKAKLDERECHFCDCCCYNPQLNWWTRQQIRAKYGLEFNFIIDCILCWVLSPLVACQNAREVNARAAK